MVEYPADWFGTWNTSDHEYRLKPEYGSGVVCFRNLDDPSKYKSAEFGGVAVEELTEHDKGVFDTLRGSLRWPGLDDTKFVAATNPGGPGHLWVKQLWLDRDFPTELQPLADSFAFVQALPTDNPHLGQAYLDDLRAQPEAIRRAWLEGEWDVFEGQVFSEWRTSLHVVNWDPPASWSFAGGLDWGYRNPGWFGLFGAGPDGDVLCVNEMPFQQTEAVEVGKAIAQMCQSVGVTYIYADSAMWAQTGLGPTHAERVQEGLRLAMGNRAPVLVGSTKGAGSRLAGLNVFHEYLAWDSVDRKPGMEGIPLDDKRMIPPWCLPKLRFHQRCKYAIRTIPALVYATSKAKTQSPEDVDTRGDDHGFDGTKYYLMSRPQAPKRLGSHQTSEDRETAERWGKRMERFVQTAGPTRQGLVPVDV